MSHICQQNVTHLSTKCHTFVNKISHICQQKVTNLSTKSTQLSTKSTQLSTKRHTVKNKTSHKIVEQNVTHLSTKRHTFVNKTSHICLQCAMPVRVMKLCGVENLIVTNAAGGLNPGFQVGNFTKNLQKFYTC